MRIVRFHLEPWQKGGSENSSLSSSTHSLLLLSESVIRRQRSPSPNQLMSTDTNLFDRKSANSSTRSPDNRKMPKIVKKLSILCSDVLVSNVKLKLINIL